MYNEYLNGNSDIAVTYEQIKNRLENRKKMQDLFYKISPLSLGTIVETKINKEILKTYVCDGALLKCKNLISKDLFLKLKVIDRKTQILGKPVATESDNNSYNFIICDKNGIEQEGYCLISCSLCNVENGKWGNVFNNILKSGKKTLSNESKLFCGIDSNNPIDIIFNGQNITEKTATQNIAFMKSIWVQQLQNGIKETYESAGKFAASKKMTKVPYIGFLGIIGMGTSSVEFINGIESSLSAGISMYKGKNISVGKEILSSVGYSSEEIETIFGISSKVYEVSSFINTPLSIFNNNYLKVKENPMSNKSRRERRGNANRKEKNWQKKATKKELEKSENNKIKKGFFKDINKEYTQIKSKDKEIRKILYEELGESIEEKYEQSVKYLNNDISIIEIVK
ncbi:PAAR-like protein [Leptotrichia trevisanii]|uniref:Uncharacterized protein n=1 Tax=Leptotrichia trevisanii TaxID=109328 RepID=A0A510JZZ3_9FUSO|nr:PAAR-like protein [Leptotrichia trevisanii]BBM44041.1 hypothetical protein JMUB3870_0131 [Leptotrichia trevisanii]